MRRPHPSSTRPLSRAATARALAAIGRRFYARGWVLGTSGNFSVVLSPDPLRLAITQSAVHKGTLQPAEILEMDGEMRPVGRHDGRPSAEARLHVDIVRRTGARAVLHTHSVWSTILSERHAAGHGLDLTGFEMLKGLEGVRTHAHREWIPIVENDQDMERVAAAMDTAFTAHRDLHAFLIRRHGLYTWGRSLAEAERHVEILEFLLETVGREGESHGPRHDS